MLTTAEMSPSCSNALKLIKAAKPLTRDLAVIEPAALRVQLLAKQLKSLLPFIALYEKQIAELFDAHPDSFLYRDLPGAGSALGPRLLTAFGTDRGRFDKPSELLSLSGVAPVRRASGKKTGKKASVHFRHACARAFMSSALARSVTALGPQPVTRPNAHAAKVTMPPCGRSPLNGFGSCSSAGNSVSPTILNAINRLCRSAAHSMRPPLSKARQTLLLTSAKL
jgi:Transposase IS116/IS110/IS902 family